MNTFKSFRTLLGLALFLLLSGTGFAQQEMSSFSATGRAGVSVTMNRDYQTLGINPANLGIIRESDDPKLKPNIISLGIGEFGASVHSKAMKRPDLSKNFFSFNAFNVDSLDLAGKLQAAENFANEGVNLNADVLAIGLAIQPNRAIGGFALGVRDRFSAGFRLNTQGARTLFLGNQNTSYFDSVSVSGNDTTLVASVPLNISELFNGSRLSLNWYREYHLAYGRQIVGNDKFKMYLGAGLKYLTGLGYMDIDFGDEFSAHTALGNLFDVNYGGIPSPTSLSTSGKSLVGNGFGVDIGATFSLLEDEKLKIGASITDLGSMTWNGNVYTMQDTLLVSVDTDGLDSYNLIDEVEKIAGEISIFNWEGSQEITVSLPTTLRLGASYRPFKMLEIGTDFIVPFNQVSGNFGTPFYAFGVDFMPAGFIRLSSGFSTSGTTGFNIPFGIYFSSPLQVFELGIASRDAITFFTQDSPTLSMALGFLRFKF